MHTESKSRLGRFRKVPIAAQLVGIFALAEASASFAAATWTVISCSNATTGAGSSGTLRYALTNAASGDTIDMTGLVCSTIEMNEPDTTIAPLPIPSGTSSSPITVLGPGRDKLQITGNDSVRIFFHPAQVELYTPNLVLEDMTLNYGTAAYDPVTFGNGGCINTSGNVTLDRVTVTGCHAAGNGGGIRANAVTLDHATVKAGLAAKAGGGIFTTIATMTSSVVTGNEAAGNGGGIYGNNVSLTDSTVSYNTAGFGSTGKQGGGMFVGGNLTLTRSTVDHNLVFGGQGGITAYNASPSAFTATIIDSTISSNYASSAVGGIYVNSGIVKVYNSTIAFNHASLDSAEFSAGMATGNFYGDLDLRFHSALITDNFGGDTPHDFSFANGVGHSATFSGTNNFARHPDFAAGVFNHTGGCPRLGPLRDNGGPTRTNALLSGSQAINVGDNVDSLPNDQRGAPFARAFGVADIGAYEVQQEIVFNTGFDDC